MLEDCSIGQKLECAAFTQLLCAKKETALGSIVAVFSTNIWQQLHSLGLPKVSVKDEKMMAKTGHAAPVDSRA